MQKVKTQIIRVDKDPSKWNGQAHDLEWAAKLLTEGKIGAFPTETVYGIGANAMNEKAVERIFEIKGRDKRNPLIVHVLNIKEAIKMTTEFGDMATALAHKFWPGPLTMILPKNPCIPNVTTAGLDTVGIRVPNNAVALELIRLSGPIAAPSANESGMPSGTTIDAVRHDLESKVDFIVYEKGKCIIGFESTIIDLTSERPTILRLGGLSEKKIMEEIGEVDIDPAALGEKAESRPKAPGMMFKHYAPKYAVIEAFPRNCERLPVLNRMIDRARELTEEGNDVVLVFSSQIFKSTCDQIRKFGVKKDNIVPFSDAIQLGQNLFHVYRAFDRRKTFILVEEAAESDAAPAVNNRIRVSARKRKE